MGVETRPRLRGATLAYVAFIFIIGVTLLAYLVKVTDWSNTVARTTGIFALLTFLAAAWPIAVAPRIRVSVTTAGCFAAVLLLEPGAAALAGAVGVAASSLVLWPSGRLKSSWYKHLFEIGSTALSLGISSVVFHAVTADEQLLTPAVGLAAVLMYLTNSALVTIMASLQLGANPLSFWWMGTRENGPAELGLLAFSFLGALVYQESPWTVVALFIPVAIIYVAFSRLARTSAELEEAMKELEALQGRIATNAKLASVGAISMDMAHQIKNPLVIVLGNLEVLQEEHEEGSATRLRLDKAVQGARRIVAIVDNLAAMGRQEMVPLDLREVVDEALGIASLGSQRTFEIHWFWDEALPKIRGNQALLQESFANVFANAVDALQDGGVITINASLEDESIVVQISDNGQGISPEARPHLFEPFYSTKARGTGLGLFTTKHILEMHNGTVAIDSQQYRGTVVTIILPIELTNN